MEDGTLGLPAIGLFRRVRARSGCRDIGRPATADTSSLKATGDSEGLQRYGATAAGAAFEIVDKCSVGSEAIPRMLTPECPVVGMLDRGIPLGFDKQPLPPQFLAAIDADFRQSGAFACHSYAFCFTASS